MRIDLKVFTVPHIKLETDHKQGNLIINQLMSKSRHEMLTRRSTQVVERLAQYKVPFSGQFFEDDRITMSTEDGARRFIFCWRIYADGMMKGKFGLYVTNLNNQKEGRKDHAKTRQHHG